MTAAPPRGAWRIATRGSALARRQADRVANRIEAAGAGKAELVVVSTRGDRDTTSTIHALGGTGIFVKEVQDAVRRGDADLAVHSAKDLPADTPPELVLAAVPERADARDALVGATLAELPTGGHVGTGSVRRRAQLAALRPDLTFGELRGNIPTRLDKAVAFDAIVVAAAALDRLELADRIAERLAPTTLLPQVGQGALAVECRADDDDARAVLATIDDAGAHAEVRAERAFLARLGGGCSLPCGALARHDATTGVLALDALLASLDGRVVLRVHGEERTPERARAAEGAATPRAGGDPVDLGADVARRLLDEEGGSTLLDALGALA
jgi:hydroxymethylbilane synthase